MGPDADGDTRGSTVGDVFRKVMGDAPLAYVETTGGMRVSEEDVVVSEKNDVGMHKDWAAALTGPDLGLQIGASLTVYMFAEKSAALPNLLPPSAAG